MSTRRGAKHRVAPWIPKSLFWNAWCTKPFFRYPPDVTVQEHIRLLRQYNEMKDVGQQLIGLIAENRGVAIASLYEDEEFGVRGTD